MPNRSSVKSSTGAGQDAALGVVAWLALASSVLFSMTAFAAFRLPLLADSADRAVLCVPATDTTATHSTPAPERPATIVADDWLAVLAERIVGGQTDESDSSDAVKNAPESPVEPQNSPVTSVRTQVSSASFYVVPVLYRLLKDVELFPSADLAAFRAALIVDALSTRAPPVRPVV
ncbi:MAG: hypothetical protein ABIH86_07660 [Planctomycetota bacterium]